MRVLIGDMFKSSADTLVNTVNCVGVMGKGIAQIFKDRYPDNYRDYRLRCRNGEVRPGEPYLFTDLLGTSVINFPTKDHWRSPSRLSYIEKGLDWFAGNCERLGVRSVAFPPLGCGNGGLDWEDVGPLMFQKLKDLPVEIEIYAPYGTPDEQLSDEFLSKGAGLGEKAGRMRMRYNDAWDLILYVIRSLDSDPLSLPVGRTVYQKICYVLTRSGVSTGFTFARGDYGPYSLEAKESLAVIANRNLIKEEVQGRLIRMTVDPSFAFDEGKFSVEDMGAAMATVDLFSRFSDTRQAEEFSTLMFAYDELARSQGKAHASICEQDVIGSVVEWKPHWNTAEQKRVLASELFYLTAFRWTDVSGLTYVPDDIF
ncbi:MULTISPECIES: macro domain-containing protein [unclassified Adlercreutzia]|uniref:type II toxin-antitoxin system antitoxin DNA ADP-ribosyl glycohydrolase DarG n=1 Tax=unclassified Adlercreutzia TaxID=2636013 RepID=UPI0013EC5B3A|nr:MULTISPECIES: macro domain-containing protein [unclassified Adlercreutzia]